MDNFEIITSILIFCTVVLMSWHGCVMKKANAMTALTAIISILQAKDVRMARGCLMNITKTDFEKWTDDEKTKAELACSTFDTVGILLQEKVVEHELITEPWRHSIRKCWENAQPMIVSYRKKRGGDYWNSFKEQLVDKIKKTC